MFMPLPDDKSVLASFSCIIISFPSLKKNPACRILRLRRVASATYFPSAAVRSLFLSYRKSERISYMTKNPLQVKICKGRIYAVPPFLITLRLPEFQINFQKPYPVTGINRENLPAALRLKRFQSSGSKATFPAPFFKCPFSR